MAERKAGTTISMLDQQQRSKDRNDQWQRGKAGTTISMLDQQQRSKDRNDQWQRGKARKTISMRLLKHVFKEASRNIFILLFQKASCKFRNYFRIYRKNSKKYSSLVTYCSTVKHAGKRLGFPHLQVGSLFSVITIKTEDCEICSHSVLDHYLRHKNGYKGKGPTLSISGKIELQLNPQKDRLIELNGKC